MIYLIVSVFFLWFLLFFFSSSAYKVSQIETCRLAPTDSERLIVPENCIWSLINSTLIHCVPEIKTHKKYLSDDSCRRFGWRLENLVGGQIALHDRFFRMNFYNSASEPVGLLRAVSFLSGIIPVCDGCLCLSNGVSFSYDDFQTIICSICTDDLQVI